MADSTLQYDLPLLQCNSLQHDPLQHDPLQTDPLQTNPLLQRDLPLQERRKLAFEFLQESENFASHHFNAPYLLKIAVKGSK